MYSFQNCQEVVSSASAFCVSSCKNQDQPLFVSAITQYTHMIGYESSEETRATAQHRSHRKMRFALCVLWVAAVIGTSSAESNGTAGPLVRCNWSNSSGEELPHASLLYFTIRTERCCEWPTRGDGGPLLRRLTVCCSVPVKAPFYVNVQNLDGSDVKIRRLSCHTTLALLCVARIAKAGGMLTFLCLFFLTAARRSGTHARGISPNPITT